MKPRYCDARDMCERLLLECSLVLEEPAHLGGADPGATSERPLLRDSEGRVYLAGTALKGVLRKGSGHGALFGDTEHQARLFVDDAPLTAKVATQVRDGVAIDARLGIATHRKKYDIELLPAGSCFEARFEVIVPKNDRDAFVHDLCVVLDRLSDGIEVGARTRRGFGRIRRAGPWRVRRYAGTSGLRAWLAEGCNGVPAAWRTAAAAHDDLPAALGVSFESVPPSGEVTIRLELKIVGSLLIRSPVAGSSPADHAQLHGLHADGSRRPVISGTTFAGALRARCIRIVHTLSSSDGGDDLVEGLFGPADIESGSARASRLRIGEAQIEDARTLRHTRVRIDPWTGGAADALLFTSEPTYAGTASPVLRWRKPPPRTERRERAERREQAERALLLLALRDLVLGDLHIGGEGAVGRGRVAPRHEDGRFGWFGDTELRLTPARGLDGDFRADLTALREWAHG